MHDQIEVLVVRFSNELKIDEIPLFRGAVVELVGETGNVLFHNHASDNKLRYSYPFIQYKRINGKAAIVCVKEGVEEIGRLFAVGEMDVRIGNRLDCLRVEKLNAPKSIVQVWDAEFEYHIRKWLPLNQENYEKYMAIESLAEKYAMLENLLVGHILSFAKGVGIHFEKQVVCKITAIDDPRIITYKGVKMMAFDAEFKSNVSIPDYVGLGKGVSLGMGTVVRKYEKKNEDSVNE